MTIRCMLVFLMVALLVACEGDKGPKPDGASDGAEAPGARAAAEKSPPPEPAAGPTAAEMALLAERASESCMLSDAASDSRTIAAWIEEQDAGEIGGRDATGWRSLAEAFDVASTHAATSDAFEAWWLGQGFDTTSWSHYKLNDALLSGDESALQAIVEAGEVAAKVTSLTSMLNVAYERGDAALQEALLSVLLDAEIPARDRAGLAIYLYELGRTDEADALLDEVRAAGEPVALGGADGGLFLLRFMEEEGHEQGAAKFRELFGEMAYGLGLIGAFAEYERREDAEGLKAFLSSAPVDEAFETRAADDWTNFAMMLPVVGEVLGEKIMLERLDTVTKALADGNGPMSAMNFGRFVSMLTEYGCSAECTAVPMDALAATARANVDGGDWDSALNTGLAATGRLTTALERGGQPKSLAATAVEYAMAKEELDYLRPLLEVASAETRADVAGRLAGFGFWQGGSLETIAFGLKLMPREGAPSFWLDSLAGSAAYGREDPERSLAVREMIVAWDEGYCE